MAKSRVKVVVSQESLVEGLMLLCIQACAGWATTLNLQRPDFGVVSQACAGLRQQRLGQRWFS